MRLHKVLEESRNLKPEALANKLASALEQVAAQIRINPFMVDPESEESGAMLDIFETLRDLENVDALGTEGLDL